MCIHFPKVLFAVQGNMFRASDHGPCMQSPVSLHLLQILSFQFMPQYLKIMALPVMAAAFADHPWPPFALAASAREPHTRQM